MRREVGDYSKDELYRLENLFVRKHTLDTGVPLLKEIHDLFHKTYGRFNNTPEQFYEFKERYLSGEFSIVPQKEAVFI
ncbi:hypothetical protein A9X05_09070 [Mycobacterium sp. E3298]|nr:hypothetical protein A9X05_09070 [Mycobacterium sp. E3298]